MTQRKKTASAPKRKIAYQGRPGAYSDLACRAAHPDYTPLPCGSFLDAFLAVENRQADLAMIPIDNSIAGRVADIHYLLPRYHLHFAGEYFLPVEHVLLGVKGARVADIKKVYSHSHALPQCRKIIKEKGWEPVAFGDTAGSASRVAEMGDKSCAAIGSALAAELYGLKVLKKNIADEKNNVTRFLTLSRQPVPCPREKGRDYITSFIFSVKNRPAALYKTLGGFATNGVNMLKLESYMAGGAFASTLFYCEVEGHRDDLALVRAIEEIHFFGKDVRVLGSYPAHPWRKTRATGRG